MTNKEINRRYDAISHLEDYLDLVRKESIEGIKATLGESEREDFCGEIEMSDGRVVDMAPFWDSCDRPYVGVYDHRAECVYQEEVWSVTPDSVVTENGEEISLEDLSASSALQVYRCLVQLREWQNTGKINN